MAGSNTNKMNQDTEKYHELLKKREKAKEKLATAVKKFRGVRHEDSVSELKDLNVKLCQAHLASIEEEIKEWEKKQK